MFVDGDSHVGRAIAKFGVTAAVDVYRNAVSGEFHG